MISPLGSIVPPAQGDITTQPVNALVQLGDGQRLLVQTGALPARLPLLLLNEVVNARVAEQLGPNQVAVLIKNGLFTLNLPPGTQLNGDLIQLRVASVKPSLSFLLDTRSSGADTEGETGGGNGSVDVQLSGASRYLTDLLTAARDPARESGASAMGERESGSGSAADAQAAASAELDAGHQSGAGMAQQLQQTVARSGLFYESHLKAWDAGHLPLDAVRQEPQARIGQALLTRELATGALEVGATVAKDAGAAMPEFGKLVQNQLDTLEHRQVMVQGYAWPGQPMQIQIQSESADERGERSGGEAAQSWSTQLSLNMPVLGGMNARVRLVGGAVQIVFSTDEAAAGQLIEKNGKRLVDAMAAAGINLASMTVKHDGQ